MEISRLRELVFVISMMFVMICWVFSIATVKEVYGSMILIFYTVVSGLSLIIALESIMFKTKPKKTVEK